MNSWQTTADATTFRHDEFAVSAHLARGGSGVIYSGSSKKIAEHGGGTLDDTNVALLVSNPGLHHRTIAKHVTTTQVAPTILRALDLDPDALDASARRGRRPFRA